MRSILLDNTTYGSNITKIALHDNSNVFLETNHHNQHHRVHIQQPKPELPTKSLYNSFVEELKKSSNITENYNGNFSLLLDISPHMAAFNINTITWTEVSITMVYNDTTQHSLPIIFNLISNTILRMFVDMNQDNIYKESKLPMISTTYDEEEDYMDIKSKMPSTPIDIYNIQIRSHPFQQTAQPQEFNIGTFSSALFVGMLFVLLPCSLAVDMVYDREMKAKNQLRVNGLSSALYLSSFFIVLSGLMLIICAALLGLVYLFDIPAFRQVNK